MTHLNKPKRPLLLLSALVVALDQWTKWWVEGNIRPGTALEIIPGLLNFIRSSNSGVAFGMFQARGNPVGTWTLIALGLVAFTIVSIYFARTPPEERLLLIALALILGGAVGNLIDRIMQGAVTDWIDVYAGGRHFPTFNVADSAISIGIGLMAVGVLFPQAGSLRDTKARSLEPLGEDP